MAMQRGNTTPNAEDFTAPENDETSNLNQRERVENGARHATDVVRGRVQRRVGDPQLEAVDELIAAERRDAHEQEQSRTPPTWESRAAARGTAANRRSTDAPPRA